MLDLFVSDFFSKTTGLFSSDYEPLVMEAINRSFGDNKSFDHEFCSYPEIPLIGETWLDFTVGVKDGLALEFDLSKRGINDPSKVIFFPRYTSGDEEKILSPIDALDFKDVLALRMKNVPDSFTLRYAGLFSGRFTDTLRMVPYYYGPMNVQQFISDLSAFGYNHQLDEIRAMLSMLMGYVDFLEISLDLKADGNYDDNIGLIFNVPKVRGIDGGKSIKLFKESGYENFLNTLESCGLIDDRWKLVRDAISARSYHSVGLGRLDGCKVFYSFRGVKISWKHGKLQQPKAYMNFDIRTLS